MFRLGFPQQGEDSDEAANGIPVVGVFSSSGVY